MNSKNDQERFEWLDAGRALGDLTAEEHAEWESLSETGGGEKDSSDPPEVSLDAIVASLELGLSPEASLPQDLEKQISSSVEDFSSGVTGDSDRNVIRPPFWRKPALGWAAAALLAAMLFIQMIGNPLRDEVSVSALVEAVEGDPNLLRRSFTSTDETGDTVGEVIWSDAQQQGVMLLSGLVANDPQISQYQLWIVDPNRDDTHPVDGGVFDISPDLAGSLAVPIVAKLPITEPAAFVITVEQPGGVVVSKQEQVVAIAKS
ncbi:MAG: anti-sigma factor [Verrucomicrobiota bacterium]